MKRRRFVPSPDGLETRQLMSVTPGAPQPAAATAQTSSSDSLSDARETRIERLPFFFYQIRRDRVVPLDLVTELQNNLRAIKDTLSPPPSYSLSAFNAQLRSTLAKGSFGADTALALNDVFGRLLTRAGANPALVTKFRSDMDRLTRLDAAETNSAQLAANDYALLAQLSMGIGLKSRTPTSQNS